MQEEIGIIIEYDKPFEVTKAQYNLLMNKFAGIVAGREDEEGKYSITMQSPCNRAFSTARFFEFWLMKYVAKVIQPVTK